MCPICETHRTDVHGGCGRLCGQAEMLELEAMIDVAALFPPLPLVNHTQIHTSATRLHMVVGFVTSFMFTTATGPSADQLLV